MSGLRAHPSAAKATDAAGVRFEVPDLDAQAAFLAAFGMEAERDGDSLAGRDAGGRIAYRAARGEPRFVGFDLWVRSEDDLDALAALDGAERSGRGVAMTDPDGWMVTACLAPDEEWRPEARGRNEAGAVGRPSGRLSVAQGPAEVGRLGHVVLGVRDFGASLAWYQDRFGLLVSDGITGMDGETLAGAFLRCDKGDRLADHHSLFLMQSMTGEPKFEHAAFEVRDIDSLMAGSDHLRQAGFDQSWGVGRHVLGAHVFDYWHDPVGFELEHWTDGDLLDAAEPEGRHPIPVLLGTQWGPPHPMLRGEDG